MKAEYIKILITHVCLSCGTKTVNHSRIDEGAAIQMIKIDRCFKVNIGSFFCNECQGLVERRVFRLLLGQIKDDFNESLLQIETDGEKELTRKWGKQK